MKSNTKELIWFEIRCVFYLAMPCIAYTWGDLTLTILAFVLYIFLRILVSEKNVMAVITTVAIYQLPLRRVIDDGSVYRCAVYFVGMTFTVCTLWAPMLIRAIRARKKPRA